MEHHSVPCAAYLPGAEVAAGLVDDFAMSACCATLTPLSTSHWTISPACPRKHGVVDGAIAQQGVSLVAAQQVFSLHSGGRTYRPSHGQLSEELRWKLFAVWSRIVSLQNTTDETKAELDEVLGLFAFLSRRPTSDFPSPMTLLT